MVVERWANLVANRRMWREAGVDTQKLPEECRQQLRDFGLDENHLHTLDTADYVEVSIPFVRQEEGGAARDFPWEFVIGTATKAARGDRPITIIRHLNLRNGVTARAIGQPKNLCFIESAPKPFDRFYGFQIERMQIPEALGFTSDLAPNLRRSELAALLAKQDWDVIHFTGLDVHQGMEILKAYRLEQESPLFQNYNDYSQSRDGKPSRPPDGLVVPNDQSLLDSLKADELAEMLAKRDNKPILVTMNLYNSASNLAALAVARGAGAAIGFQDAFDDDLTDDFYSSFYLGWRLGQWQLLPAFAYALQKIPAAIRMGTGLVLWTGSSLLPPYSKEV
jgi:hypothetical protein